MRAPRGVSAQHPGHRGHTGLPYSFKAQPRQMAQTQESKQNLSQQYPDHKRFLFLQCPVYGQGQRNTALFQKTVALKQLV